MPTRPPSYDHNSKFSFNDNDEESDENQVNKDDDLYRSTFTISTEIHYYTTSNSIVIWRRFQTPPKSIRVSLRKLFMDDCETAS
ncbi:hypothetical protein R3W88_027061 [Solanum pinnatisectum]|uniref:Uncharacterized protein n=1 Tax=Solanum pinnatisectum TaxID=50273 RepID=A0AAV9LF16_9SOLN|nr:hypothetical protein R3W88_027061 [Solanum pinnatisectum]